MSYFLQNGDMFAPTPGKEAVLDSLPAGNYIVVETMQGLMFKRVDRFEEPGRMYGNINDRAERILTTFLDRVRSTGVLLEGEKGSGKSQLARNISYAGYEMGIPTILINAPFHGDPFNALLASIEQPAIVLMDEFEKVYSHQEHQEQVLTLLDGMMTSKKLFVLTVNNKYRVNEHMKNRPGRIYYSISFDGLAPEFVREYCEDNLHDKDEIENVLRISALFKAFNFDMLKAIVEEMNRYKETAFDAIELLNAKPIPDYSTTTYDVQATSPNGIKSVVAEVGELPMAHPNNAIGFYLEFEEPVGASPDKLTKFFEEIGLLDDEPGEDHNQHFAIKSQDLKKVDVEAGRYEFLTDGFTIIFKRRQQQSFSMRDIAY